MDRFLKIATDEVTELYNLLVRAQLIAIGFPVPYVAATRIYTAVCVSATAAYYSLVINSYEYVSHVACCVGILLRT